MGELSFVAVGDITTDAFIRLKDVQITCGIDRERCQLCVRFGDKVPYEFVEVVRAVGNSPNAAVSARRLGLPSSLITNIGDDENGRECRAVLEREGVSTSHVVTHSSFQTNYHYVLWYEEERTILVKHQEYPYRFPDIPPPSWLYVSSLAPNSLPYHQEMASYLLRNPTIQLAFQPGTFQIKLGHDRLSQLYRRTALFFCNRAEAKTILKIETDNIGKLLEGIRSLGPKTVVITDGPKGAYAFDGKEYWHIPMYPDPKPPVDRTGAGDAFSSTVTVALALGKSLPEALAWGPINSMSVVQYVGAREGLLTREKLEEILRNAPPHYKPQKLA